MQETLVQFLGRNLPNFREIWPINWKRSAGEGIGYPLQCTWASLVAQLVKNLPATVGDLGLVPGLGRPPGEGKGHPLRSSGLENSMDCIVPGVAKSRA